MLTGLYLKGERTVPSKTGGCTSETTSSASGFVVDFRRGVLDSSVLYPSSVPSPPRPARSPHPVKRPSSDIKKDRSGLVHGLRVGDTHAPAGTA